MHTPDPHHAQECFAHWLESCGVDLDLAAALLTAAYTHGWNTAARALLPPSLVPVMVARIPIVDAAGHDRIAADVRRMMAVPASPDVAAMQQAD